MLLSAEAANAKAVMTRKHYQASTYKARTSVGYLVKRAQGAILESIEPAFAAQGFTLMQWVVLMYLRDGLAKTAKDICAEFRHDSGALTRVIDQLEERDCIERRRSTTDRRAIELHLTPRGRQLVQSLVPVVVDRLNLALADFSRDEVQELTRLLNKLIVGVEAIPREEAVS
jgi:DNA-binding MarR family transcriptional regulator